MVEIFLRLILAFYFFPLSLHPDRALSLALVSGYLDQLSEPLGTKSLLPIASTGSAPPEQAALVPMYLGLVHAPCHTAGRLPDLPAG